jgi:hypothetical protein
MSSVPSEAFTTFRYSAHSVPKATNLFNNAWEEGRVRAQVYTRKTSQSKLLTSSGETVDVWVSREKSASLAFFERLRLLAAEIFLTEALVTLAAMSCSAGSSAVAGKIEGAVVPSFGGSSSSLQEEEKLCITRQK